MGDPYALIVRKLNNRISAVALATLLTDDHTTPECAQSMWRYRFADVCDEGLLMVSRVEMGLM